VAMTTSGELVGRLNRALGRPDQGDWLGFNSAACEYARMRGADIGSGQHEGLWCLNEAASLSGVGLRRVESVLGLQPSGLQFHDDVELMLEARAYDPEQHWFPNLALSSVMGGLPGSSHPLVFGRDENGAYVYQPGVSGHDVSWADDAAQDFTSGEVVVLEWTGALNDWSNGADQRLLSKYTTTGNQRSWSLMLSGSGQLKLAASADGTAVTTVTTTITAEGTCGFVNGSYGGIRAVWTVGTDVDFYYSTDGTTWTFGETETITTVPFAGTEPVSIAGRNAGTADKPAGRCYSARIEVDSSDVAEFLPALFIPGNRGHGATATDAQGNTWTVARAGSPLSVIDDGDGNGKRARFKGTSLNYLKSNQTPNLSGGDFFAWARMSSARDANRILLAQYGVATERSWWFRDSFGTSQFVISTDGTADSSLSTLTAVPTWYSSSSVGWLGVFYDHSEGDLVWYDGGSGTSPSWSAVETDAVGVLTMFNSGSQITVGSVLGGTENWSGDVFEAGLGASTSSMYDYSHFDADQINRHQWRIDNTVTGGQKSGETWTVTYTDSAEDANDPVLNSACTQATFTGTQWIVIPHDAALELGSGGEISAAMRLQFATGGAADERFMSKQNTSDDGWCIQRSASNERVAGRADDGTNIATVGDNADNITYDTDFTVVAAFDSANTEAYVDGASVETDATTTLGDASTGTVLRIGSRPDGNSPSTMVWKSAAVLSKRVTDDEALAMCNELAAS